MKYPIKVLFLAAEANPFIKVGGLADVAGSLPHTLRPLRVRSTIRSASANSDEIPAVDVRLVIPLHNAIRNRNLPLKVTTEFTIEHAQGPIPVQVFETDRNGMIVYLIASELISDDEQLYHADASQDGPKYTLFSLAALELVRKLKWSPDVLHANDWHTALAVYALDILRSSERFFKKSISVLGLHNLPYLGVGAGDALAPFGLTPAYGSALPWWAQDMPLPMGLLTANHIVTVSPGYAQEILTPEYGSGLDEFLQSRSQDITGILNGIEIQDWDPNSDLTLAANYSLDRLESRRDNKAALQNELGLPIDPDIPLLTMVTRLDPQKGVDLLPNALRQVADLAWQAVILGTGTPSLEGMMRALETSFPDRLRAVVRFDSKLSRRIYSAADAILIPSRYEPCGLTQMIAMRYGCIPIAHATGGLRDTIQDYADFSHSTGFLFQGATSENLGSALRRALRVFSERELWHAMQTRGMQKDFSWESSAKQYLDLYVSLITSYGKRKLQQVNK